MTGNAFKADSWSFVCFYLLSYLETEQQALVCSLGRLVAEVIRPMAVPSLSFRPLKM